MSYVISLVISYRMLLIETDSNYDESTQMLLKNSNKNLLPYNTSERGGNLSAFQYI